MPCLSRRYAAIITVAAAVLLIGVTAEKHAASVASMSVAELEDKLQVCHLVFSIYRDTND